MQGTMRAAVGAPVAIHILCYRRGFSRVVTNKVCGFEPQGFRPYQGNSVSGCGRMSGNRTHDIPIHCRLLYPTELSSDGALEHFSVLYTPYNYSFGAQDRLIEPVPLNQ